MDTWGGSFGDAWGASWGSLPLVQIFAPTFLLVSSGENELVVDSGRGELAVDSGKQILEVE